MTQLILTKIFKLKVVTGAQLINDKVSVSHMIIVYTKLVCSSTFDWRYFGLFIWPTFYYGENTLR